MKKKQLAVISFLNNLEKLPTDRSMFAIKSFSLDSVRTNLAQAMLEQPKEFYNLLSNFADGLLVSASKMNEDNNIFQGIFLFYFICFI